MISGTSWVSFDGDVIEVMPLLVKVYVGISWAGFPKLQLSEPPVS